MLRLQQLIGHPQSWLIDPIGPVGYRRVTTPVALQGALAAHALTAPPYRSFSGVGSRVGEGGLEDYIISGPTRFSRLPRRLADEAATAMKPVLEAFCGCELAPAPLVHGLRTYLPGATLAPHLDWPDRWVVSATLCVQRNATLPPWPVELRGAGRDETASVALQEGDALLYEGSRLWHGRPAPLQGGEYVGVFVGFVPVGYPAQAGVATRAIVHGVRRVKGAAVRWLG